VPQQTAQIFSAFAGQKRSALRFWQMEQDKRSSGFEPAIKLPRENSKTPVSEGGRYKDEYIAGENITP
jgi:hypothetical protein